MSARLALAFWTLTIIGAASLVGQTPPRDASAPKASATGGAAITGTVLADEPTRPTIRRAIVSLSRSGVEDIRYSVTDDRGRFQFSELPAGVYTLGASKAAYISTSYGALQPGMAGTSISLTDGQRFTANPIALVRGAVLAGRILDRNNRPVEGSLVAALAVTTVNGQRRLRVVSSGQTGRSTTNAHGEYRIFGLVAGDYLLAADVPNAPGLPGQTDRSNTTAELLAWAQRPGSAAAPPASRFFSYARTLFPGTAAPADAMPITLARGEEKAGVDFSLQYVAAVRISGIVTRADGVPAANALIWRTNATPDLLSSETRYRSTATTGDGSFTLTGVPPGDWRLVVSSAPNVTPVQWGVVDIAAAGRDILDVPIRLQPGTTVSGRIAFADAEATAANLSRYAFALAPLDGTLDQVGTPTRTVKADGTFVLDGIMPGRHQLKLVRMGLADVGDRWHVRSAMLNGRDLIDEPLQLHAGQDVSGILVTMTRQMASITGTLVDAAGRPTPQFYVFAFPTNRAFWTNNSRRIVSARADVNGVYTIDGLPAGEYFVCALTELDRAQQYESTYLELLAPSAIKMTLRDGEKLTQSLRVGGS